MKDEEHFFSAVTQSAFAFFHYEIIDLGHSINITIIVFPVGSIRAAINNAKHVENHFLSYLHFTPKHRSEGMSREKKQLDHFVFSVLDIFG